LTRSETQPRLLVCGDVRNRALSKQGPLQCPEDLHKKDFDGFNWLPEDLRGSIPGHKITMARRVISKRSTGHTVTESTSPQVVWSTARTMGVWTGRGVAIYR